MLTVAYCGTRYECWLTLVGWVTVREFGPIKPVQFTPKKVFFQNKSSKKSQAPADPGSLRERPLRRPYLSPKSFHVLWEHSFSKEIGHQQYLQNLSMNSRCSADSLPVCHSRISWVHQVFLPSFGDHDNAWCGICHHSFGVHVPAILVYYYCSIASHYNCCLWLTFNWLTILQLLHIRLVLLKQNIWNASNPSTFPLCIRNVTTSDAPPPHTYICFTALWTLSENTQVSQYQKGKTILDFTEARDSV